jgi:hypothetical protein
VQWRALELPRTAGRRLIGGVDALPPTLPMAGSFAILPVTGASARPTGAKGPLQTVGNTDGMGVRGLICPHPAAAGGVDTPRSAIIRPPRTIRRSYQRAAGHMGDVVGYRGKTALERLSTPIWYGLFVLHAGLGVWAALGLIEFLTPSRIAFGLANRHFPGWMQLLHWLAIGAGAAVFLLTWRRPPRARVMGMALAYGLMAVVCLAQTILFLQHPGKWRDMGLEYAAYLAILWLLAHLPPTPARPRA